MTQFTPSELREGIAVLVRFLARADYLKQHLDKTAVAEVGLQEPRLHEFEIAPFGQDSCHLPRDVADHGLVIPKGSAPMPDHGYGVGVVRVAGLRP